MKNRSKEWRVARKPLAWIGGSLCLAFAAVQSTTAPYDELTNTYRTVTNFNVETVRGMHVAASGRLLMINTHGSTLNMWTPGGSLVPQFYWPTLNNPIAVDAYTDTAEEPDVEYAVVLGGGSHALALHELVGGRITNTLQLPGETGDVVVDQDNHRAFVSCPGTNTVVQVGLPDLDLEATFTVESQRPRFLYLDRGDAANAADNVVYVAPELSGNNTISTNALQDKDTGAFLLASPFATAFDCKPFLPGGLPDDDLFRVTPHTPSGGQAPTLAAASVLRNAGTILEAHGRNPFTGEYWIVGVEALNAGTTANPVTTEPELNGKFARNQLTIAPTLDAVTRPWQHTTIDLDAVGGAYDARYSVSFPYGLGFHPTGYAAIVGSASDQLRGLGPDGARVGDLELPVGSIPRGVAFDATGYLMFVYCWGTNEVQAYDVGGVLQAMADAPYYVAPVGSGLLATFDLGADPTDPRIRHGRELFYDADNSKDGRVTCNHCHPGGGMDLLGWNIQDFPHDHKDLMVTQSLKSIEDTFPYHWRGERDLEAFNVAFAGLLGGAKLGETPGGEFDDFKAFVFSLQAHANPKQDPRRVLNPALSTVQPGFNDVPNHVAGNPITGQGDMDIPSTLFERFSCADCHGKVAGTVGDPQNDDVGNIPGNLVLDVAHFRQLNHKESPVVSFNLNVGTSVFKLRAPRNGYGMSQDGDHPSVFDFLNRNPFAITQQQQEHLAAFVEQADQGLSPAAHVVYQVNDGTDPLVLDEIDDVLFAQAGITFEASHGVSIAAIGSHEDGTGNVRDLTWYYLPATQLFYASDPNVTFPDGSTGTQPWNALKDEAGRGRATFTLIGVPPGNALRFAHDVDDDGLVLSGEIASSSEPFDPDTDGDGFRDGHEVANGADPNDDGDVPADGTDPALVYARLDHTGASYAKVVLVFSEPVTLEIVATDPVSGHSTTERRYVPRVYDSVTVQRLRPSLPAVDFEPDYPIADVLGEPHNYSFEIRATDLGGNTAIFTSGPAVGTRDQLVLLPFVPGTKNGDADLPPAFLSRTIEDLQWASGSGSGPTYEATATVAVRFDVPELQAAYANPPYTPNGSSDPYERQVVVFQVLHFDSSTNSWSIVPELGSGAALEVSAPTDRLFTTLKQRENDGPDAALVDMFDPVPLPGPYLLSTPSDSTGAVEFEFTLSDSLLPNDRISLNVIAILEQDTRDAPQPNEFWGGSIGAYNKPVTAEADRELLSP